MQCPDFTPDNGTISTYGSRLQPVNESRRGGRHGRRISLGDQGNPVQGGEGLSDGGSVLQKLLPLLSGVDHCPLEAQQTFTGDLDRVCTPEGMVG